ncbi:MAG: WbqC family protein [Prevotella sp.]|nr:WbqC family protein [Prevotella sp.]
MTATLSSTYFGPVQWYQKLLRYDHVFIEHCDSYQKQTYRNRCLIASTNGVQALTIPVEHSTMNISDHGNWRHQHWQALQSAYGDSPFFEYYEDDLRPFYTERWEHLYDYNEAIRQKMCELLDIHPVVSATTEYQHHPENDFRNSIQPKIVAPDADFQPRRYYQVYEQKHGFLPNLSILDLLFNMGPESIFYLL